MSLSTMSAPAPAKLNLFFEVTGRRVDGFHDVQSFTVRLNVADKIVLALDWNSFDEVLPECPVSVLQRPVGTMRPGDLPPTDGHNLIIRAANLFLTKVRTRLDRGAKWELPDHLRQFPIRVRADLEKRIPLSAGLGGGSSDAATTLVLMNRMFNLPFCATELFALASELGSDVPLFLLPDPIAYGTGRGERLVPVPAWSGPTLYFVLLKPPFGLATASVFRQLDRHPASPPVDSNSFLTAWAQGDPQRLAACCFNRLESIALSFHPELEQYRKLLLRHRALTVGMTGSGTCLYALYDDSDRAEETASQLRTDTPGLFVETATIGPETALGNCEGIPLP